MMDNIDEKLLTKEFLGKAVACETPEAFIALAKEHGVEVSTEKAQQYLEKLEDFDVNLSEEDLKKVAGGRCWDICIRTC